MPAWGSSSFILKVSLLAFVLFFWDYCFFIWFKWSVISLATLITSYRLDGTCMIADWLRLIWELLTLKISYPELVSGSCCWVSNGYRIHEEVHDFRFILQNDWSIFFNKLTAHLSYSSFFVMFVLIPPIFWDKFSLPASLSFL